MSKYVCAICGYVYDEAVEKVPFSELPSDWKCPLCGAEKGMFEKMPEQEDQPEKQPSSAPGESKPAPGCEDGELREVGFAELSAICSNLARGSEKQYKSEQAALFTELAEYYAGKTVQAPQSALGEIAPQLDKELNGSFKAANSAADSAADRGAKRVLVWSEKVTKIMQSLLMRYEQEGEKMLEGTRLWVCDICGFMYIGEAPPAVCPVCKVPAFKILEVK